jgi:hypothetical protein
VYGNVDLWSRRRYYIWTLHGESGQRVIVHFQKLTISIFNAFKSYQFLITWPLTLLTVRVFTSGVNFKLTR